MKEESNLVLHAKRELALLKSDDDGEYSQAIFDAVLEIVRVFSAQGHSGFSAPLVAGMAEKLMMFEPLTPLTGDENEWNECSLGLFQNKRCSHVFKQNGEAYDIEGIIWREPDGASFTNYESRVPVTFPYTPKHEYRDRPAEAA